MNAHFFLVTPSEPSERGQTLSSIIGRVRRSEGKGGPGKCAVFEATTSAFAHFPETAIAYWGGDELARVFRRLDRFSESVGDVQHGAATKNDFRYVRLWWEVEPDVIGFSDSSLKASCRWAPYAKGGEASPYFADVYALVNWHRGAREIEADVLKKYSYLDGNAEWILHKENNYFEPGVTFPRRSSRLYATVLPKGCVFSHGGQAIFPVSEIPVSATIGYLASDPCFELLSVQLPSLETPQYEVGQIRRTPVPDAHEIKAITQESETLIGLARVRKEFDEICHQFALPELLSGTDGCADLRRTINNCLLQRNERNSDAASISNAINDKVSVALGLGDSSTSELWGIFSADSPAFIFEETGEDVSESAIVADLIQWCLGVVFGRWDVRMARDEELIPDLQGPFERLPRVAPGGLVGPDGLPATRGAIASEAWLKARPDVITEPEPGSWEGPASITAEDYPVQVAWDGILVDDPDHEKDIVRRVREVLRYVYGRERAAEIEEEALEILRADGRTPRSLRDWFRNSKATELGHSFFDFHIRRYSKSRRKAPIYWRLCSSPGRGKSSYGVWLYSHRLSGDSLWTALNEYVRPKIGVVERRQQEKRDRLEGAEGREARRLEGELEEAEELLEELRWFEEELTRVAEEEWAPVLDDGVVINLAPLRELVPWKDPDKHWKRLEKGEYDWSQTAMRYWPDRVREKCREDKSLAIAHELESLYEGD